MLMTRHIKTIGRSFVLLFFVASSGFTVIRSHCTMEALDCCKTPNGGMSTACRMMDPAHAQTGSSMTLASSCHSITVVGGLLTDPTVVEKDQFTGVVKAFRFATLVQCIAIPPPSVCFQSNLSTSSHSIFPPPVEKYVLNSSFLI